MEDPKLQPVLTQLRERIVRSKARDLNEQDTKATLIEPLLRALGWDTEDIDEVAREFKLKKRDKPVDYGLLLLRTPRLFVEAKALGQNLDDRRWASQIMGYASVAGVEWIVLTDGDEYRLYNAHAPVSVEQKLFCRVRITDSIEEAARMLSLIAKDRLTEKQIEVVWRTHFVDRQVEGVLKDLFAGEGDLLLLNWIGQRTSHLSPEDIRGSIARCEPFFKYPEVMETALAARWKPKRGGGRRKAQAKPPVPGVEVKAPRPAKAAAPASGAAGSVSVLDLIQAGVIRPPLQLARTYKGQEVTATIQTDGSVACEGQRFNSLSTAGGFARAFVRGDQPGEKLPATNGWAFWRFKDSSGTWRQVGDLRAELEGESTEGSRVG